MRVLTWNSGARATNDWYFRLTEHVPSTSKERSCPWYLAHLSAFCWRRVSVDDDRHDHVTGCGKAEGCGDQCWITLQQFSFFVSKSREGTPRKIALSGVVRPASQIPDPIYNQNLEYSLPYLWPDQKFETLFMTWTAQVINQSIYQNPVSGRPAL